MSEGSVFVRGSDGRACATYKDVQGKARYLYAKTKAEIRRKLRQALKDRDDGIVPAPKMTVGALLDEFLYELKDNVSHRTYVNRESLVRIHLKPHFGATRLSKLDSPAVRNLYRDKLAEGLSSGTVKRLHIILNQAMREAVRSKYIPYNPIADVKPPKQTQSDVEVLSPDDVRKLLAACRGDRYEGVIAVGVCGLRIGEALSLRHEDIDLQAGTLKVRRTYGKVRYTPRKRNLPGVQLNYPPSR
jgi:integrase